MSKKTYERNDFSYLENASLHDASLQDASVDTIHDDIITDHRGIGDSICASSNHKEYEEKFITVSVLSKMVQNTLESQYRELNVEGEISGFILHSSGHMYFSLKDDNAVIDCVFWRGGKVNFKPEDGMKIQCKARMSTYGMRSKYQLIILTMRVAGVGDLFRIIQERKKKLMKEGLFDRKRPISKFPMIIGVITSPTGAVIRDILIRLKERFVRDLVIYPAKVQGDGADIEVCNGIKFLNNKFKDMCGDIFRNQGISVNLSNTVIIVARGGGSVEDLSIFSEENVVRAISTSEVPIISAVGHETDFGLSDFAADLRAPTPTAAAEIVAPLLIDVKNYVNDIMLNIKNQMLNNMNERNHRLNFLTKSLRNFEYIVNGYVYRYDEKSQRLKNAMSMLIEKKMNVIKMVKKPTQYVLSAMNRLQNVGNRLNSVKCDNAIFYNEQRLSRASDKIQSLSYENVLKRGFCVVESDGMLVKTAKEAENLDNFDVVFADGKVNVDVVKKGGLIKG